LAIEKQQDIPGCPSPTDSEEKRKESPSFIFFVFKFVVMFVCGNFTEFLEKEFGRMKSLEIAPYLSTDCPVVFNKGDWKWRRL
jgi:hypothetical protein